MVGFPDSSVGKESSCNAGDPGSIPDPGRSPGKGKGYPLQYTCLQTPMDKGAWRTAVCGVTKSRTQLKWLSRDFISPAWYNMGILCSSNGKESACDAGDHSSIPESGRSSGEGNGNPLQYSCLENSMGREAWQATFVGLQRVGHHWMTSIFYNSKQGILLLGKEI